MQKTKSKNKQILKALVISAKNLPTIEKNVSNELEEDEFSSLIGNDTKIIEPPFDPKMLAFLPENSSELIQIVEVMEINIEGFGQRLSLNSNLTEVQRVKFKNEINEEEMELQALLDIVNAEEDMTKLRRNTRKELEIQGNGYWELLPNIIDNNKLCGIKMVPAHTMRITKQDTRATKISKKYLDKNFKWREKIFFKKFRRYVQIINHRKVYFKEWDDPRIINKKDGSVASIALEINKHATPMYHHKIFSSRANPYGLPRLIGNLFSIFGSRAADNINFTTFQNNNVPSMMITVSNGMLTEASITRIQDYVNSQVIGSDNYSKFLIVEAETQEEGLTNPGTMKIDVKPLADVQRDDQLFQNYDKNNSDKLRRSSRLPPIFIGKSEEYNKNTSETSRRLADEQIFDPERKEIDRILNNILKQYGFRFYTIKSNTPNVTDDEILVKILSNSEKTGGITPSIARKILSDVFNQELPLIKNDKFDPDIPFSLTMADAVKRIDGSAPNQGQIPNPKNQKEKEDLIKKIFEKVDPFKRLDDFFELLDKYNTQHDDQIGIEIFGESENNESNEDL